MAHFAKLNNKNVVIEVHVVSNDIATSEQVGIDFLNKLHNTKSYEWKQTSYNTRGGVHLLGGTPLRKNYAGIDHVYIPEKDAFIPPQPTGPTGNVFHSWKLNETTWNYDPPYPYPDDGAFYYWNELTLRWELIQDL